MSGGQLTALRLGPERAAEQLGEFAEVLGSGGQVELVAGSVWASQAHPVELQDALEVAACFEADGRLGPASRPNPVPRFCPTDPIPASPPPLESGDAEVSSAAAEVSPCHAEVKVEAVPSGIGRLMGTSASGSVREAHRREHSSRSVPARVRDDEPGVRRDQLPRGSAWRSDRAAIAAQGGCPSPRSSWRPCAWP